MGKSLTLTDLFNKLTIKDTLFSAAIVVLGYHTYVTSTILRGAVVETAKEYAGNPGAGTSTDIPFGFCAPEAEDSADE